VSCTGSKSSEQILSQFFAASEIKIQQLRTQLIEVGSGDQNIKASLEGIIGEQRLMYDKETQRLMQENERLVERVGVLQDQYGWQQSESGPPARTDAIQGYLDGLRASAGLPINSSTGQSSSRRGGGDPAGGGGGSGPGGSLGGFASLSGAPAPARRTQYREPPQPDPDDGDGDDHDDDWDEEEEEEEEKEDDPPEESPPAARNKRAAKPEPVGVVTTIKSREQEKVVVPKFPTLVQVSNYGVQLSMNLISASCFKDCAEIGWLNETKTKTYLELADSGLKRYESLDVKLCIALSNSLKDAGGEPAQLYQELLENQRVHNLNGTVTKGRQVYWMILNYHKTNDSQSVVIGIDHLVLLEWKGDKKMYEFKQLWDNIMRRMTDTLSEPTLRGMLLKKLRQSKELKEDIAHYDRFETAHADRNITYLWNCVNRAIRLSN
jgi:hypothetical protein